MPLQDLKFRPGVNRESTSLANEGGWFDCDKVRWRSGYPEKIGGWEADGGTQSPVTPSDTFVTDGEVPAATPTTGGFFGTCRSLYNWLNLSGYNLLALGTSSKYYIQNGSGGLLYDVTPIREVTTAGDTTFAATDGSSVIVVTHTAHAAGEGDFVSFTDAVSLGGAVTADELNREFQITFIDADTYSITVGVTANSSDVGDGGSGTIAYYQLGVGSNVYANGVGWGAGGFGGVNAFGPDTGWGLAVPISNVGITLRLWTEANFGQDLIFNPRGGAMYYWANNANPNVFDRAQLIEAGGSVDVIGGSITIDSTCPSVTSGVLVSDGSRFVIAFGANDPSATILPTTEFDPMLIRWSDQESFATWTPAADNQAGDFRLSQGSRIVSFLQTRQEILVWTDSAVYSMQYLGPPYVWGVQIMGSNTSIIGPNAVATANNVTYWMGTDKFYAYTGRVETLPCTLRSFVFNDINLEQSDQFFAGTNEGFNEIWWFYCSISGPDGSNTVQNPNILIDSYVVFNHLENTWYYGNMGRTAWLDTPLRGNPTAVGYANVLVYHEQGNDDGTTNPASPIEAYCQTSDFDIGDGHNFAFAWRIIPDVTFDGSDVDQPTVDFTVRPRQNPGANYGPSDSPSVTSTQNYSNEQTYNVQEFTQYAYVRIRGRQMAFKVSSNTLGVAWQLGTSRLDLRQDGRR